MPFVADLRNQVYKAEGSIANEKRKIEQLTAEIDEYVPSAGCCTPQAASWKASLEQAWNASVRRFLPQSIRRKSTFLRLTGDYIWWKLKE